LRCGQSGGDISGADLDGGKRCAGSARRIERVFAEAEANARTKFEGEGVDTGSIGFLRYGKFRYQNQEHTTEVLLEGGVTEAGLTKIIEDFHNAYEQEYTYRLDALVEMVSIQLVARVEVGKLEMVPAALGDADAGAAKKGMRQADYALEGKHDATIYDGKS